MIPRLTHADRSARRKMIAQSVLNGMSIAKAAATYGVSMNTVRDSCRENGVRTIRVVESAIPNGSDSGAVGSTEHTEAGA